MTVHKMDHFRAELRSEIEDRFYRLLDSERCGDQDQLDLDFCETVIADEVMTDDDYDDRAIEFSRMEGSFVSSSGDCEGVGAEAAGAARATASLRPRLLKGAIPSTFVPIEDGDKVQLQSGGLDGGLMVGFFCGRTDVTVYTETMTVLEAGQNQAKSLVEQLGHESPEGFSAVLGGEEILVFPSGGKVDNLIYKYRFRVRGIEFLVHSNPKGGIQPVRVRYGAESMMGNDFYALHRDFVLPFLSLIGFPVVEEKVSRADFQVLVDVDMQTIFSYFIYSQVVTKFRKFAVHGRLTAKGLLVFTITLGSREKVQLCIYDKRRELRDHFGLVKEQLFIDHCVGEEWYYSDRPITRIEFRCGRTALKIFGVNSVLDLQHQEQRIVSSLTYDWFRVLAERKVRGHENAAKLHAFWERVRGEFFKYFPGASVESKPFSWKSVKPVSVENVEHLSRMALGCLTKVFAYQRGKQFDKSGVRMVAGEWIRDYESVLYEKINGFADRVRLLTGVSLGGDDGLAEERMDAYSSWRLMRGAGNGGE